MLTAIDSFVTLKIEIAIRSIKASFGRDATSVMASSERGEHKGIKGLLPLLKTYSKAILHYMCLLQMMRV